MTLRPCARCLEPLPPKAFPRNTSMCRPCCEQRRLEWYAEDIIEYEREQAEAPEPEPATHARLATLTAAAFAAAIVIGMVIGGAVW